VEPLGVSRPGRGTRHAGLRDRAARRTRVLIAEDDDSLRTLIRLTVDVGELDIDEAADGETAVLLAHENPPDVALLDWSMPGLTGLDVCRALRADPRSAGALIVVVTARVLEGDREQALAAGADHYVGKPFSPVALLELVRHAL
jgi:CheY-like chemotaxis protein